MKNEPCLRTTLQCPGLPSAMDVVLTYKRQSRSLLNDTGVATRKGRSDASKEAHVTGDVCTTALMAVEKRRDEEERAKARREQEKLYREIDSEYTGNESRLIELSMLRALTAKR